MLKQTSYDLKSLDIEKSTPLTESDLGIFPGSTEDHSKSQQTSDIVLRMECMSDRQMKVKVFSPTTCRAFPCADSPTQPIMNAFFHTLACNASFVIAPGAKSLVLNMSWNIRVADFNCMILSTPNGQ